MEVLYLLVLYLISIREEDGATMSLLASLARPIV